MLENENLSLDSFCLLSQEETFLENHSAGGVIMFVCHMT